MTRKPRIVSQPRIPKITRIFRLSRQEAEVSRGEEEKKEVTEVEVTRTTIMITLNITLEQAEEAASMKVMAQTAIKIIIKKAMDITTMRGSEVTARGFWCTIGNLL